MATDENTRLRIRQYFVEQIDEEAADAIMESMPPVPWTELATKTDLARIETRIDGIDNRLDGIDNRLDGIDTRFDGLETRFDGMDARMEMIGERFDGLREGLADQFIGLEGRLSMRYMEAVRLIVFAVLLLMTGVIATGITVANLG